MSARRLMTAPDDSSRLANNLRRPWHTSYRTSKFVIICRVKAVIDWPTLRKHDSNLMDILGMKLYLCESLDQYQRLVTVKFEIPLILSACEKEDTYQKLLARQIIVSRKNNARFYLLTPSKIKYFSSCFVPNSRSFLRIAIARIRIMIHSWIQTRFIKVKSIALWIEICTRVASKGPKRNGKWDIENKCAVKGASGAKGELIILSPIITFSMARGNLHMVHKRTQGILL